MKNNAEILDSLRSSKFLICKTSKGLIAPTTINFVDFDAILERPGLVYSWEYDNKTNYRVWYSFYIVTENGVTNVNRKIKSLLIAGLLKISPDRKLQVAQESQTN